MNTRKIFLAALSVSLLLVIACSQTTAALNPKVTLTPQRVLHHGHVDMRGTGFTPKSTVLSHLRRPDGTEFPVLPMLTNEKGEFAHDIDSLLLSPGLHTIWVEDAQSKKVSEQVQFEVTVEQK